MSEHHHRLAKVVANHLLSKWTQNQWTNGFISNTISATRRSAGFPSPDADFFDKTLNTKISLEFKPETESKRGMMTGLGQSIAYLQKANASYLVSARLVSRFDMGSYLTGVFNKFIYGKLPVGLILYDMKENSKDITNIKIVCDIDSALIKFKHNLDLKEAPYWAFWRDWPGDGFYKFALSAKAVTQNTNRNMKVWEYFFDNYFSPPSTRSLTINGGDVYEWDMQTKMIPFEDHKKKLTAKVNSNEITMKVALDTLDKKCWGKNHTDNCYKDYKKNYVIFMTHLNMWDENFYLTPLGERFVSRFSINKNNPQQLKDEIAQLLLVEGKYDNLISDIVRVTNELRRKKVITDRDSYLDQLYQYFETSGFIAKNPNRTSSGVREFFTAEKQLCGHLNLIQKNGGTYFFPNEGWKFNHERIEYLVDQFYKNYGDVSSESNF